MLPLSLRPFAFIDTETTGLDPNVAEVIEVAIIKETQSGQEVDRWETKIHMERPEDAHPRALQVNNYSEVEWLGAPKMSEVAQTIADKLDGCIIVGHNPKFDLGMLEANIARSGVNVRLPYHAIDTVVLVWEHLVPQGLEYLSLDRVREFLGWEKDGAHRAMKDVEDTRRLFRKLTEGRGR